MAVAHPLFPGLDAIVNADDPRRRSEAMRRISDLFIHGADGFQPAHVEMFDGVLSSLIPLSETEARTDLAERLSTVANAPPRLVNMLALDDEISIAGPLLRTMLVDDATLAIAASAKGQQHLLAIAARPVLLPAITDVMVRRGDRDVMRRMAKNSGVTFSHLGYTGLVRRAEEDGALAVAIGQRSDLSPANLNLLLENSSEIVRRRMFDAAGQDQRDLITRAMTAISGDASRLSRDFAPAQRAILALTHADELNEGSLLRFARGHQFEETVAALSALSGVGVGTIDQLLKGDRDDPILILGKSLNISWATVRALMSLRLGPGRTLPAHDVEDARQNFERLVPATAQRVLTFWQTREVAGEPLPE